MSANSSCQTPKNFELDGGGGGAIPGGWKLSIGGRGIPTIRIDW